MWKLLGLKNIGKTLNRGGGLKIKVDVEDNVSEALTPV